MDKLEVKTTNLGKVKISYIVISDIHFGHNKNKTANIVNNLLAFFRKYNDIISKVDVIFLAGDVYERLLSVSSSDNVHSAEWLVMLSQYCKKYKIKLRILEGTPSHDSKQCNLFSTVLKELDIDVDFKYIDKIDIEYMKEHNAYVLYIPDEMHHDAKDTLEEVKQLMEAMKIHQVDIAIMHGAFNYQLPMVTLSSSHDEQEYLSIVRHYISIGHIHSHSVYKRILAQGSFDRLNHNEEEDKGAMYIKIDGDNKSFLFLKNDNALIFKTIDITTEDMIEAINKVEEITRDFKDGSHIRLTLRKDNPVLKSVLDFNKKFPRLHFIVKTLKEEESISITVDNVLANAKFDNLHITPKNIESLLLEEIGEGTLDPTLVNIIKEELSNVL